MTHEPLPGNQQVMTRPLHDGDVVVPMSIYPAAYVGKVIGHLRGAGAPGEREAQYIAVAAEAGVNAGDQQADVSQARGQGDPVQREARGHWLRAVRLLGRLPSCYARHRGEHERGGPG